MLNDTVDGVPIHRRSMFFESCLDDGTDVKPQRLFSQVFLIFSFCDSAPVPPSPLKLD